MTLRDPIGVARERFAADTSEHALTVLRDDGLYRHLRFGRRESNFYRFDLVTWPGYLAIVGDVEDLLFARTSDMFGFFSSAAGINPDYWSEKLQQPGGRRSVRVFSEPLYRQRVLQWLKEQKEELEPGAAAALKTAVDEELLRTDKPPFDERDAIERLVEFEHGPFRIYEPYEWTLTEFNGLFLWSCWAIVWGIEKYNEHLRRAAA